MGHNVVAHLTLSAVLFVAASLIFDGGGVYSALFFTTSDIAAALFGASVDPAGSAESLSGILPVILSVVVNIVMYYILAGIIIFLFTVVRKKK